MAEAPQHAGTKRPHSESTDDGQPSKRRKVRRRLHRVQQKPQHIEPAPQDPLFAQGQLLRSITAALAMAGFDSVKPTALEMFRSHVEEYMLRFLRYTKTSMSTARRTKPTPLDFTSALALMPNTRTASLLTPQLDLAVPENISCPSIPEPAPPPLEPPDFSILLQPLVADQTPTYIPRHFPSLPSQHTWKHTPVFPEREKDARKMREKATEEGIMAEQALRKLAAAAKAGAVKAEKRKEGTLSGDGKLRNEAVSKKGKERQLVNGGEDDMFGNMLKEIGTEDGEDAGDVELGLGDARELRQDNADEGVAVNWDVAGWRSGGRKRLRL